jgi:hypothetical protein
MDSTLNDLLAELDALGIEAREDRGEVMLRPAPPPHLLTRLRHHKEAVAQALWARAGRERQRVAIERLAADRRAWIAENRRLGLYRGRE